MTSEWKKFNLDQLRGDGSSRDKDYVLRWIQAKEPTLLSPVIAFYGPVSAGKSALVNFATGAYIRQSSDDQCTAEPTLIRGVSQETFDSVVSQHSKVEEDEDAPSATGYRMRDLMSSDLWPTPRAKFHPRTDPARHEDDPIRYNRLYTITGHQWAHLFAPIPTALTMETKTVVFNADLVSKLTHPHNAELQEKLSRKLKAPVWVDTAGITSRLSDQRARVKTEQQLLGFASKVMFCLPTEKVDGQDFKVFVDNLSAGKGVSWSDAAGWMFGNNALPGVLTNDRCRDFSSAMSFFTGGRPGFALDAAAQMVMSRWWVNMYGGSAYPFYDVKFVMTKLDKVSPGKEFLKYIGRASVALHKVVGCTTPLEEVMFCSLPSEPSTTKVKPELAVYDNTAQLQREIRPEKRTDACEMVGIMYQKYVSQEANAPTPIHSWIESSKALLPRQLANRQSWTAKQVGKSLKCGWAVEL